MNRKVPLILALITAMFWAAGCGSAPSSSSSPPPAAPAQQPKGYMELGLASSPMTGPGSGTLYVSQNGGIFNTIAYAKGANSFLPGVTPHGHRAFVATEAGKTYVLSLPTGKVLKSFATPSGGRLAVVAPDGKTVYIIGNTFTAAYRTSAPYTQIALADQGGNAFVISPGSHHAYLAGNMRSNILEFNLPHLTVASTGKVGRIGDLALSSDGNHLWAADMFNGDMYVLDTASMQVSHTIKTPEGDPNINLANMMATPRGFMQIAMGPSGKHLYAAGFSGHVLVFNTNTYTFTTLTIQAPSVPSPKGSSGNSMGSSQQNTSSMGGTMQKGTGMGGGAPTASKGTSMTSTKSSMVPSGPPKLSGLAILPGGRQMLATAENYDATLLLSTRTGKTKSTFNGVGANRWVISAP